MEIWTALRVLWVRFEFIQTDLYGPASLLNVFIALKGTQYNFIFYWGWFEMFTDSD